MANEDVVAFDDSGFSLHFDGSAHGLGGTVDGFAILDDGDILLSLTGARSIPGVSGTVDDSDIVRFDTSSESFSRFFDGSDVGLTSNGEDIDGLELLPDGRLLVSTRGSFSVPGVSGGDEDIIAFTGTLGDVTSGTWEMYSDGSDIGLGSSGEDVGAIAVANGDLHLSTWGNFSVNGLSGADDDVFICGGHQTGGSTSCSSLEMFFDGSTHGLSGNEIHGIDLP